MTTGFTALNNIERATLNDKERAVSAAHASVVGCESKMLDCALRAGEILLDILQSKLVAHGDRKNLLKRTCGHERVGQRYIQLAKNRSLIEEAKATRESGLSISEAIRLIQAKTTKPANPGNSSKPPKSLSHWTDDELSVALDMLGANRLLQILSPDLRKQLETRLAGQLKAQERKPSKSKVTGRPIPTYEPRPISTYEPEKADPGPIDPHVVEDAGSITLARREQDRNPQARRVLQATGTSPLFPTKH
jgi:hypothetical protein